MELDALLLSRIQFAFVISFHIIFPSFTIGLASWMAVLEALWLRTGENRYRSLYKYWSKIFAVAFGLGVVSGIVMSYQIGTNWSAFSVATGNVLGPLFSYEVLTAFFLQAGFLGVILFMGAVSLGTITLDTHIPELWFSWPNIAWLAPVPVAVAIASLALYRALKLRAELAPFLLSMFLFWLGYSGLAISVWPNIIPHTVSIWEASSSVATQEFMLWGFVILIPIILTYTAYSYWVFRGKVTADGRYH